MGSEYMKRHHWDLIWIIPLMMIILGCSHSRGLQHSLYPEYVGSIRTVLVLPPELGVFQMATDGTRIWHEDYSRATGAALLQAVVINLTAKRLRVHIADEQLMREPETQRLQALFRAVQRSIQLHIQGPQPFPAKLRTFDYELGPVTDLLERYAADALVIALGQQIFSEDQSNSWIGIAVIEPQGRLIWYNKVSERTDMGIDNSHETSNLVDSVLHSFAKEVL